MPLKRLAQSLLPRRPIATVIMSVALLAGLALIGYFVTSNS